MKLDAPNRLLDPLASRLDFLDALRGWAILGVVAVHSCQHTMAGLPGPVARIFLAGMYGVQLFFLVSSFTLLFSLRQSGPDARVAIKPFFIKRIFRIVPLYYCGIVFYYFFQRYYFGNPSSMVKLVSCFTFTNGFWPGWIGNSLPPGGWSIIAEMSFYLLFPLLASTLTTSKRAATAFLLTGAAGVSIYVFSQTDFFINAVSELSNRSAQSLRPMLRDTYFFYFWFPMHLPVFILGIFTYHVVAARDAQLARYATMCLIASVAILAFGLLLPMSVVAVKHLVVSVGFAFALAGLSANPIHVLVNRWTNRLGEISFSVYLLHFAVLDVLTSTLLTFPAIAAMHPVAKLFLLFAATMVVSAVLATATYHWIEQPFIAIGRKLARAMSGPACTLRIPEVQTSTPAAKRRMAS